MDRDAIVEQRRFLSDRARKQNNASCRTLRYLAGIAPDPAEPDDDIPEIESRARYVVVRLAKKSRGWADLTETQLAEILP